MIDTLTPVLSIHLIGRPRFERDGESVAGPRGHKAWAVLARLVRSTDPVSRQTLVDELFDEADDPMGALRWSLAELRRRTGLPDAFSGNPVSLGLGDGAVVDVATIASAGDLGAIPEGQFLEGIDVGSSGFESWLLIERQRVDGEVLSALRKATLQALSARQFERAVEVAGAMVRRAPFDEGPHVLLVKALASSGDAEAALAQADASEATFLTELGVEASSAVRAAARPSVAGRVPGVSAVATARSLCEAGLAAVSAGAADAGIESLRGACAAAEESADLELQSRCLMELGTALVHSIRGYDDEGAVILGAAAAVAERVGANLTAAKALSELAYIDLLAGRRATAAEYLGSASELATEDPALVAALAGFEAMNLSDQGKLAAAADRFDAAVELSRSAGAVRREAWNLGLGTRTLFLQGRLDDAMSWARMTNELVGRERWTAFRPWPEAWLAHARLAAGDNPADVRADAEANYALARQIQDPCWEAITAKVVGLSHLAEGDVSTALEWMADAGMMCGRVTDMYTWIEVEILIAEAGAALGADDVDRADAVIRRAIEGAAKGSMDGLLEQAVELLAVTAS